MRIPKKKIRLDGLLLYDMLHLGCARITHFIFYSRMYTTLWKFRRRVINKTQTEAILIISTKSTSGKYDLSENVIYTNSYVGSTVLRSFETCIHGRCHQRFVKVSCSLLPGKSIHPPWRPLRKQVSRLPSRQHRRRSTTMSLRQIHNKHNARPSLLQWITSLPWSIGTGIRRPTASKSKSCLLPAIVRVLRVMTSARLTLLYYDETVSKTRPQTFQKRMGKRAH
jgi:hypothetical protein